MTRANFRQQGGFTLIEVSVALVIMVLLAGVAVSITQQANARQNAAATGDWLRVVASAGRAYEKANQATLIAGAGPTTPATASPAQLASFLPTGFNTVGPQGHSFTVRWIEPTAGKLQGMVVLHGGDNLSGMSLIQAAGQAGGGAGYVDPGNAAQGKGPRGTWTVNMADWGGSPGSGKPLYALFYDAEASSAANDYLNRTAITGKPEVNRMSTAIDMGGNNLNAANGVNAQTVNANQVTASDVDATNGVRAGAMAMGKDFWGAAAYPYETIQVYNGGTVRFNSGSRELAALQADGTSLFRGTVAADGNVMGQEVYANGWFRSRGDSGWYSEKHGGGWYMSDPTWIRAYNNKSVFTAGTMQAGNLVSTGNLSVSGAANISGSASIAGSANVSGTVNIGAYASPNTGCSPNGALAREANGAVLSCTNGVWRGAGGITGTTVVAGPGMSQGPVWAIATCPAGTFLVGGGYHTVHMQRASSQEAPQVNIPQGNGWGVYAGASSGAVESRFLPYAVCAW